MPLGGCEGYLKGWVFRQLLLLLAENRLRGQSGAVMFVFVTLFDYLSALYQHYLLILTSNLGERGKFPVFTSITRLLSLLLSQEW